MRRFQKLPAVQRRIVFYSEGPASWPHLGPIAQEFLDNGEQICWVSSHSDDPGLKLHNKNCWSFYIGVGAVRIFTFSALDCGVLLTTSPDFDQNQIKRSRYNTTYVYVHHSLVSHHMVYRPKAFAAFDAVLCAGPYHVKELEAEEAYYSIPSRLKLSHGYGRLDHLIAQADKHEGKTVDTPHVLIAPSWGNQGLIEAGYIQPLLQSLFAKGYAVTLRPHPRTVEFAASKVDALGKEFPSLVLDKDIVSDHSILCCDVLISDWSGAALEYAFARLRPVVFMDIPRKINNPDYENITITPLEVRIRQQIGVLLTAEHSTDVGQVINDLIKNQTEWEEKISQIREQTVFNIGQSAKSAHEEILKIVGQKNEQRKAD